ncbi:MAG: lysoplasmalogenase [Pyrinomonadaceae bacterium]
MKPLLKAYLAVLFVELAANAFGAPQLSLLSKPFLLTILGVYFARETQVRGFGAFLVAGAIIFSWFGDMILLWNFWNPKLFQFGLFLFLIAHTFYILFFRLIRRIFRKGYHFSVLRMLTAFGFCTVMLAVLYPNLYTAKIPVVIYSLVITLMFWSALEAFVSLKSAESKLIVFGALLFVISDSIIGVSRFVFAIPFSGFFVMLTYGVAQMLLIIGSAKIVKKMNRLV